MCNPNPVTNTLWEWDRMGLGQRGNTPPPLFSYRHFSVSLQTLNYKLHKSHICPKTNLCMPEWSPSLQTPVWFVQVREKPPVSTPPCHLCSQDPADHVNWTHRPTACQNLYVHQTSKVKQLLHTYYTDCVMSADTASHAFWQKWDISHLTRLCKSARLQQSMKTALQVQ